MAVFTVAIVGGSVAGLAVALHLEKLGINYILLETYSEIAPQVGASIGLNPNGIKICQQLGCYDEVCDISVNIADLTIRNGSGAVLWHHRLLEEIRKQHGYNLVFTERQKFLTVLKNKIQHQDRLRTNQRVVRIEETGDKVKLHTKTGETFEADIAIGADGVHSPVRAEMWRLAEDAGSKVFGQNPGADVTTDYGCVYGISSATGDIKGGDDIQVHMKDRMVGIVADNNNVICLTDGGCIDWFVFFKLDKPHRGLDFPRYTKEQEIALLEQHTECIVTSNTTFGEIYNNVKVSQMTALPHHCFPRWHYGRIMTMGDANHKMSPIAGQGGCITLESTAALCDNLHAVLEASNGHPTAADIDSVFTKTTELCQKRAASIVQFSEMFQQLATWSNRAYTFIDTYVASLLTTPILVDQIFKVCEGSYISKTLPEPVRPTWKPEQMVVPASGERESWFSSWFSTAAKV